MFCLLVNFVTFEKLKLIKMRNLIIAVAISAFSLSFAQETAKKSCCSDKAKKECTTKNKKTCADKDKKACADKDKKACSSKNKKTCCATKKAA